MKCVKFAKERKYSATFIVRNIILFTCFKSGALQSMLAISLCFEIENNKNSYQSIIFVGRINRNIKSLQIMSHILCFNAIYFN